MQTPAGFPEYGVLVKASTMYVFISFFLIAPNDRGYGHLAVYGSISFADFQFAVVNRRSEFGSKTAGMHSLSQLIGISQPMNKRVLSSGKQANDLVNNNHYIHLNIIGIAVIVSPKRFNKT